MIRRIWRHFHHDPVPPRELVTDHPALRSMLRTKGKLDNLSALLHQLDLDEQADSRPSGHVARDMIAGTYEGEHPL